VRVSAFAPGTVVDAPKSRDSACLYCTQVIADSHFLTPCQPFNLLYVASGIESRRGVFALFARSLKLIWNGGKIGSIWSDRIRLMHTTCSEWGTQETSMCSECSLRCLTSCFADENITPMLHIWTDGSACCRVSSVDPHVDSEWLRVLLDHVWPFASNKANFTRPF